MTKLDMAAIRITPLVLVLLCSAASADVNTGISAYRRGDYATAFSEFNDASGRNDPLALNVIGIMYAEGLGVERNEKLAVDWFFKAQTLGSLEASANLGRMYADGRGVPQSSAAALQQYRNAALGGYLPAMNRLAEIYEKGELGVTADPALALEWRARLRGTPTGLRYSRPTPERSLTQPEQRRENTASPLPATAKTPRASHRESQAQLRVEKDALFEKQVFERMEKYRQRERKLQVASTDSTPVLAAYLKDLRIRVGSQLQDTFSAANVASAMTVSLSILRDGTVRNVELDHGSGSSTFDRKVLASLKRLDRLPPLPAATLETADVLGVTVRLPME